MDEVTVNYLKEMESVISDISSACFRLRMTGDVRSLKAITIRGIRHLFQE
jgi:hypothetical protein